jgi:murein DD-endopeptidase MepM/ murein hydrolase activator NlpD
MKFNLKNSFQKIIKNIELSMLVVLVFLAVLVTKYHNSEKKITIENYKDIVNNTYFQKSLNYYFNNLVPKYKTISHKVSQGETFDKVLNIYSISSNEKLKIKKTLSKSVNLNNLTTNQIIKLKIEQSKNNKILSLIFPITRTKQIQLTRNIETDLFIKKTLITNLNKKIIFKEGKISQSLYKTATDLGVKPNLIIEFARIYGFQIDFQRDIKKNDNFQILYEIFEDDDGKFYEAGNILLANLKLSGVNNSLYYFDKKKYEGHYDENGRSIKKALMKTPINGARLSSPYGMRKHPIDGYNKMHKGTDFAAPMGTPIMASGSGTIIKSGWCGGGGNCIKIKHNSSYQTVYAHLSKFSNAIKKGSRVKQGQIIGYVGSTGKSTGPHLHYEVIFNGKKINSQKMKLPSGKALKGENRKIFETKKIKLEVLKSEIIMGLY